MNVVFITILQVLSAAITAASFLISYADSEETVEICIEYSDEADYDC